MSEKKTQQSQGLGNRRKPEVTEEDVEKDSFGKRASAIRDKFKLGPHHKMERFTIILGTTLSVMFMFVVVSFISTQVKQSALATTTSVYTEDFNFSLSDQRGTVEGVFGNKERTDVMVLFKMENSQNMSTNAENYQLFITGEKKSMKYEPKVTFALFGSTGYGIIRFENDTPLAQEVLDVTIRANVELASLENTSDAGLPEDGDETFEKYDQAKIFVNPGAEDITILDNLKTGERDPMKLYIGLVAIDLESEIMEDIEEETTNMRQLLNRSSEYSSRLTTAGYIAPPVPHYIEGDYVDDNNVLKPARNIGRHHDLNYWSKSIKDGYVNQVMTNMTSFETYMAQHGEEHADIDEAENESVDMLEILQHEDGSELVLQTVEEGSSPSVQVAAKGSVESLTETWRSYLSAKITLQRDLMQKLLILDADVQSQPLGYSEQTDKKSIQLY